MSRYSLILYMLSIFSSLTAGDASLDRNTHIHILLVDIDKVFEESRELKELEAMGNRAHAYYRGMQGMWIERKRKVLGKNNPTPETAEIYQHIVKKLSEVQKDEKEFIKSLEIAQTIFYNVVHDVILSLLARYKCDILLIAREHNMDQLCKLGLIVTKNATSEVIFLVNNKYEEKCAAQDNYRL